MSDIAPDRNPAIPGVTAWRLLPAPDHRLVCLLDPLLFGAGRITVAEVRERAPEDELHFSDEAWDFRTFAEACGAYVSWTGEGEPWGAIKHHA